MKTLFLKVRCGGFRGIVFCLGSGAGIHKEITLIVTVDYSTLIVIVDYSTLIVIVDYSTLIVIVDYSTLIVIVDGFFIESLLLVE